MCDSTLSLAKNKANIGKNEPNFADVKMNITNVITMRYEKILFLRCQKRTQFKPNLNPKFTRRNACEGGRTQFKPNFLAYTDY